MNSDYKENQKKYDESPAGELNREAREKDKAINVVAGPDALADRSLTDLEPVSLEEKGTSIPPLAGSPEFIKAMDTGFSSEEPDQQNPFDPPAEKSANPFQELLTNIRLAIVCTFLPKEYEVVRVEKVVKAEEFMRKARKLWDEYEPKLGRQNGPVAVLQLTEPTKREN